MLGKIEQNPQLVEMAKKLRGKGLGFRKIAQEMNEEFGADVSHMAVKTYFDNAAAPIDVKKYPITEKEQQEIKDEILSTSEQLKNINKEMWELYHEMKDTNNDKSGMNRMNILNKILRQLEFNAKEIGKLSIKAVNITQINYVDFSVSISEHLKEWEKQGFITINKPLIPSCDD